MAPSSSSTVRAKKASRGLVYAWSCVGGLATPPMPAVGVGPGLPPPGLHGNVGAYISQQPGSSQSVLGSFAALIFAVSVARGGVVLALRTFDCRGGRAARPATCRQSP